MFRFSLLSSFAEVMGAIVSGIGSGSKTGAESETGMTSEAEKIIQMV